MFTGLFVALITAQSWLSDHPQTLSDQARSANRAEAVRLRRLADGIPAIALEEKHPGITGSRGYYLRLAERLDSQSAPTSKAANANCCPTDCCDQNSGQAQTNP